MAFEPFARVDYGIGPKSPLCTNPDCNAPVAPGIRVCHDCHELDLLRRTYHEYLEDGAPKPPVQNDERASDFLSAAAEHLQDRADTYDQPTGERSIPPTVAAFKAITGIEMTNEQGWLFMTLLKAVRTQQGKYKRDNYEDGAAYFALAGEAAAEEAH